MGGGVDKLLFSQGKLRGFDVTLMQLSERVAASGVVLERGISPSILHMHILYICMHKSTRACR